MERRDPLLQQIEAQVREAIRDALNRGSRKPFHWGGLAGYGQIEAIAQALAAVPREGETDYLHRLKERVEGVVSKARSLAEDLAAAHQRLVELAQCLGYPRALKDPEAIEQAVSAATVRADVEAWLRSFPQDLRSQPAQAAVCSAGRRLWRKWQDHLLPCYEIAGLPPDNLKLEALFGELRGQERRISGRRSTRPLREFGQCRVLMDAKSERELLDQLREVPVPVYQAHRERLAAAEAPRQRLYRLHRDPGKAVRGLLAQHADRRQILASEANS